MTDKEDRTHPLDPIFKPGDVVRYKEDATYGNFQTLSLLMIDDNKTVSTRDPSHKFKPGDVVRRRCFYKGKTTPDYAGIVLKKDINRHYYFVYVLKTPNNPAATGRLGNWYLYNFELVDD